MTLHDELRRIADQAPVADVPPETWSHARRARTRDRALVLAATAAVVALVASLATWMPRHIEPPIASGDSLGVPDRLYAVPERMSDRENDGSWMRDEVTDDPTVVGIGAAAWVTHQGLPVVVGANDGRYHLLDLADFAGNNDTFARGLGTPVVALSPDGRRLAYGYAVFGPDSATEPIPSGVRVVDLTTGELREIPVAGAEGTAISHIEWSPDGSWLAFTGEQLGSWTKFSMGTSSTDEAGPVVGRVPPGSDRADFQRIPNDDGGLAVDDQGTVILAADGRLRQWAGQRIRALGHADPYVERALGSTADGADVRLDDDVADWPDAVELVEPDGSRPPVLRLPPQIGPSLSLATELMTSDRPTVSRPEPDWPMSDERRSLLIGLGVAAAIAVLLALRRLGRRVLQRRSAR